MRSVDEEKNILSRGTAYGEVQGWKAVCNLVLLPLLFVWLGVCNNTFPVTLFSSRKNKNIMRLKLQCIASYITNSCLSQR